MSSIIALDDYNKAKEYEEKYIKAINSKIDFTSKSHKEKALKHYEIAASAGNVDAIFRLAVIASNHGGLSEQKFNTYLFNLTEENKIKILDLLKRAANLNHKEAIEILVSYYGTNDKERLVYLLMRYENGYKEDISSIIAIYKVLDPKQGILFMNKHIQENNIDIKTWRYTIDLASLYEKTNQIEERNHLYRIIATNEKLNYNNINAYLFVAKEYENKDDYENAIKIYKFTNQPYYLKQCAQKGKGITPEEYFQYITNTNYLYEIYECYSNGFGTNKDEKKAFELLKSHYDDLKFNIFGRKTPTYVIVKLAECYYFGRGTQHNLKEALKLFLEAEKKPDIKNFDILYAICWCYYYTQDYVNAFKRLTAYTTRDGVIANWAYYLLGNCYYNGWGTTLNYSKAYENYKKGVDKNHSDSFCQVGNCYYYGYGVSKNFDNAFKYWKLGYDQHKNILCAYNLGLCYEYGFGCNKDIQKAYDFYKISSLSHKPGKDAVLRLQPEIDKINHQKKLKEEQQKCEELTKEIITKIKELKENQVKTEATVKTEVVEGSAKETLNELIGLTSVKKEIQELENFIKVMNMRKKRGLPTTDISKHMVFTGNPGTGKTTVARIVAQIYKENGIIEKGHLVETDREGLVGQYIGETGKKTRKVIESAMGGVLFIDEAYSLIPKDSDKDYGPEAVATLLKMMEDYKNDFVVIVAGYEDEMKFFIDSNPGLKSRFTSYINFPDYTPEEMQAIFKLRASKDMFEISEDAEKELIELWKQSYKYKNLGNGRCVRNVYEKVQRLQSNRLIEQNLMSDEDFIMILKEDIPKAEDIFR